MGFCKTSLLAIAQEVAEVSTSSPHLTPNSVPMDDFQNLQSYNEKSLNPRDDLSCSVDFGFSLSLLAGSEFFAPVLISSSDTICNATKRTTNKTKP